MFTFFFDCSPVFSLPLFLHLSSFLHPSPHPKDHLPLISPLYPPFSPLCSPLPCTQNMPYTRNNPPHTVCVIISSHPHTWNHCKPFLKHVIFFNPAKVMLHFLKELTQHHFGQIFSWQVKLRLFVVYWKCIPTDVQRMKGIFRDLVRPHSSTEEMLTPHSHFYC